MNLGTYLPIFGTYTDAQHKGRYNFADKTYLDTQILCFDAILAEQQVVAAKSKTVLVKNLNGFFILMSKSLFADS